MSEGNVISALMSHCPIHEPKKMTGFNPKNIQEALNYLSKMEAFDCQHAFIKDRSSRATGSTTKDHEIPKPPNKMA
jgi:hypothetical protein